jgi:hypothetical protein
VTSVAGPAYVTAVLTLFVDLPDTPRRASAYDRAVARSLFERGVSLDVVESALLLGSLRRRNRPEGALRPLPPVRSLAYFASVIDEILQQPLPAGYREYLRSKADRHLRQDVQKTTLSSDR